MPRSRSQDSGGSAESNASSFHSVRITDKGKGKAPAIASSSKSVPEETAPQIFQGAVGVYDQNSKRFFAVTPENSSNEQVARWDQKARKWAWENKSKLTKALVEMVPTLIQGAANLMPDGRAKTIVNAVGVGSQGMAVAHETYEAVKASRAGEPMDPWSTVATGARVAALGNNLASSVLPSGGIPATVTSNVGTYANAFATGVNLVHDPHAGRGGPMYMHPGTNIGYELGDIPPGYQAPATDSSNSSLPTHYQPSQAGSYGHQPSYDPSQYQQHQSDPAASSSTGHPAHFHTQGQPHGRG
ncbi:hypothetical protein ACIRPX_13590 [Streptomyces sp. NPDC101225]|uniref:hypothetical protein n=1 Tax=Streptomyces sp. NPDC101225 TaxID=3366135 RepID=UPI0038059A45